MKTSCETIDIQTVNYMYLDQDIQSERTVIKL